MPNNWHKRIRTQANNNKEQIGYYNQNKKDKSFNCFLTVRKQTRANKIIFSIVTLIDKTNKNDNIYFKISDELSDFNNDNVQFKRPIQWVSEGNIVGKTSTDRKQQQYTARNDRWVSKQPLLSFRIISNQKGNIQQQE